MQYARHKRRLSHISWHQGTPRTLYANMAHGSYKLPRVMSSMSVERRLTRLERGTMVGDQAYLCFQYAQETQYLLAKSRTALLASPLSNLRIAYRTIPRFLRQRRRPSTTGTLSSASDTILSDVSNPRMNRGSNQRHSVCHQDIVFTYSD